MSFRGLAEHEIDVNNGENGSLGVFVCVFLRVHAWV